MANTKPVRSWWARYPFRPALHFLMLGALFYGLDQQFSPTPAGGAEAVAGESVTITADQVDELRTDWHRQHGRWPTRSEEEGLLGGLIDQELLYREALRRGLDQSDLVVRRRLTGKMRFLAEDPTLGAEELYRQAVALGLGRDDLIVRRALVHKMSLLAQAGDGTFRPSEAEVRAYYERHQERFVRPARVRLSHVFLSRDRHADPDEQARRLLEELRRAGATPREAALSGDSFPLGHHLPSRTAQQLEHSFGQGFATRVMGFEPGTWRVAESTYGLHLVWIHEIQPPALDDLEAVRAQVLRGLLRQHREHRLALVLEQLRESYTVRVERPRKEVV